MKIEVLFRSLSVFSTLIWLVFKRRQCGTFTDYSKIIHMKSFELFSCLKLQTSLTRFTSDFLFTLLIMLLFDSGSVFTLRLCDDSLLFFVVFKDFYDCADAHFNQRSCMPRILTLRQHKSSSLIRVIQTLQARACVSLTKADWKVSFSPFDKAFLVTRIPLFVLWHFN